MGQESEVALRIWYSVPDSSIMSTADFCQTALVSYPSWRAPFVWHSGNAMTVKAERVDSCKNGHPFSVLSDNIRCNDLKACVHRLRPRIREYGLGWGLLELHSTSSR